MQQSKKRTYTEAKIMNYNFRRTVQGKNGIQFIYNPLLAPPHLSKFQNSISIDGNNKNYMIKLKNKNKTDSEQSSFLIVNNTRIEDNLQQQNKQLKIEIDKLKQQAKRYKQIIKDNTKKYEQEQYNKQKLQIQNDLLRQENHQQKYQIFNQILNKLKVVMCQQCANNFNTHCYNDPHMSEQNKNEGKLSKNSSLADMPSLLLQESNIQMRKKKRDENIQDQNKVCQLNKKMQKLLKNYNEIKDSVQFYVDTSNKKNNAKQSSFLSEEQQLSRQYYRKNLNRNVLTQRQKK